MSSLKQGLLALIAGASITASSECMAIENEPPFLVNPPKIQDLDERCSEYKNLKITNPEIMRGGIQCLLDYVCEVGWSLVGITGGKIPPELTKPSSSKSRTNLFVASSEDKYFLPTLNEVKKDFETYIRDALIMCDFNGDVELSLPGYKLNIVISKVDVSFKEDETITTIEFPISIYKGTEKIGMIDRIVSRTPIRFSKVFSLAERLTRENIELKGEHRKDQSDYEDLKFQIIHYEAGEGSMYFIQDEKSQIGGSPYNFVFTTKFDKPQEGLKQTPIPNSNF